MSLIGSMALAIVIMAVSGIAQGARMSLGQTLVQSQTDDVHLGRVMSLNMMQMGFVSLGTFLVAVIAEYTGVRIAVGATGALLALVTIWGYLFSPRVRQIQ